MVALRNEFCSAAVQRLTPLFLEVLGLFVRYPNRLVAVWMLYTALLSLLQVKPTIVNLHLSPRTVVSNTVKFGKTVPVKAREQLITVLFLL